MLNNQNIWKIFRIFVLKKKNSDTYTFTNYIIKKKEMCMQDKHIVTTRDQVNRNYSKLPHISQTKRSVWFDKRRFSNI